MATLDRTWYNTLVDDDGSGTTGTVWNKSQVNAFINTIDVAIGPVVVNPIPGNLQYNNQDFYIHANTSDGADNKSAILAGGGGFGGTRGGQVWVGGNEHPNQAGNVILDVGLAGSFLLRVGPAGSEVFRVGPDGVVKVQSGRLQFPTSPLLSADARTLDDYEEKPWTPVLLGSSGQSGQVYTKQVGSGVKVGKHATVVCELTLSTLGTLSGYVQLGGFPWVTGQPAGLQIAYFAGLTGNVSAFWVQLFGGGTQGPLYKTAGGTGSAASGTMAQGDFANNFSIVVSGSYITN